jgi:hypothetical protein
MKNLPQNSTQDVLYTLISEGSVSIMEFPYLSGFRTRISNLKLIYGLPLRTDKKQGVNKFGRSYCYHRHYLTDKEKAIKIYNKMQEN